MKYPDTPMEKIKAYHAVKGFLTVEKQKEIAKILGLNAKDLATRIKGKDNEVEFILMIYLLDWCKSIVGFEEGVAKLTDTVATDLLIELNTGKRIVVEIKSTKSAKYSISQKQFEEKIKFANSLNAELYFAIKMSGYWTLYSSSYMESKNRKISLNDNYLDSEFGAVFGERTFMFPKGLKIESMYSKNAIEGLSDIMHNEYGRLIRYRIKNNNKNMLTINSNKNLNGFYMFMFEVLQDVMSIQKQEIIKINDDRTMIIEEFDEKLTFIPLSQFILSPIKHMMNEFGDVYNLHEYLVKLIDEKSTFITREHIISALCYLVERDYNIMEQRECDVYRLKDFIIKKR